MSKRLTGTIYYLIVILVIRDTVAFKQFFLSHSADSTRTNSIEEEDFSASTLIEKANRNLGKAA